MEEPMKEIYPTKTQMGNIIKKKNPVLGVVSAFLPGVGQFLKGHIKKGITFLAGTAGPVILKSLLGSLWFVGGILGGAILLVLVIFWIYNIYDAYSGQRDWKKIPVVEK